MKRQQKPSNKQGENNSTIHGTSSEQEMNKTLQRENKVETDEHLKRQTNSQTVWRITWRCNIRVVFCDKTAAVRRIFKYQTIYLIIHLYCHNREVVPLFLPIPCHKQTTEPIELTFHTHVLYSFSLYLIHIHIGLISLWCFSQFQDRGRL